MKPRSTTDGSPEAFARTGHPVGRPVRVRPATPDDADAVRALAWLDARQPPSAIRDDILPAQTEEELEAFRPASYRRALSLARKG